MKQITITALKESKDKTLTLSYRIILDEKGKNHKLVNRILKLLLKDKNVYNISVLADAK